MVFAFPPPHEPPLRKGRDAFHCVPDFCGQDGDAVERIPTGFRGARRDGTPEGSLSKAIHGLTNATGLRVSFRSPYLLLHLDRDALDPAASIRHPATAARLTGRSSFDRVRWSDRSWDHLQPVLDRGLGLTVQPKARSQDAVHLTRVNLAGWHLTDWELLEALSLAGRTRFTVFRSRVSFEPNPRRVRPF